MIIRLCILSSVFISATSCAQSRGTNKNDEISATSAVAAEATPQLASTFLSGVWKTDATHPKAAISAGLTGKGDPPIRVASNYWVDDAALSHRVDSDRGGAPQSIEESSGAMVEGRNLELIQVGAGQMGQGTWSAVVQPVNEAGFSEFSFSVRPQSVTQVLDLTVDRQFVLTFSGYPNTSCPVGELKVFVNGKPLTYRDKSPVVLINGNSVWAYGKSVYVQLLTACKIPQGTGGGVPYVQHYSGSMKVMNTPIAP
jgi:hypothetical protein